MPESSVEMLDSEKILLLKLHRKLILADHSLISSDLYRRAQNAQEEFNANLNRLIAELSIDPKKYAIDLETLMFRPL